jgi:hypothetical protein
MKAGTDFANVKPFWKTFSIYGSLTIYRNFAFTKGGDVSKNEMATINVFTLFQYFKFSTNFEF